MDKKDIKKYDILISHLYAHHGKDEELDRLIEIIVDETREVVKSITPLVEGKSICPKCKGELIPRYYKGYYDEFPYWECECYGKDDFFTKDICKGGYV